jgi:hypothetical protein
MRNSSLISYWGVSLALAASACVATVDNGNDDDIAVIEQALGGFTEVVNFGPGTVLDIGPIYTVFVRSGACSIIDVVGTTTGEAVYVPQLSGCPVVTVASSQSGVLIADRTSAKIYRLSAGAWQAVADTGSSVVSGIKNDDTQLYWTDGTYARRVT